MGVDTQERQQPERAEAGRDRSGASSLPLTTGLALVAGMACFGSATPFSKIVGRGFPTFVGAGLRTALAAAVLLPIVAVVRRRRGDRPLLEVLGRSTTSDRWLIAGIGVIGTSAFTVLMLLGMQEAPGAIGAVTMAATPAVTGIAAAVFLHEHLGRWRIAAIVLAVGGVVAVNLFASSAQAGGSRPVLGSALVFGAVCCEAAYSLLGKRLTADLDPVSITAVAAVTATVAFVPLAAWELLRGASLDPTAGEWWSLVWWGLGTMALGSWLWFLGMREVAGSTAAGFMGVMPVSALVLSYVLLGESFQWAHAVGMALVLVAIAAAARSQGEPAQALRSRPHPGDDREATTWNG